MSRTYKINHQEYPSVTTILDILDKPILKQWAVNMAIEYLFAQENITPTRLTEAKTEWKNVSQKAKDIGSEIHNLIEQYIKNGRDAIGELKPEVENGFIAFLEWEKENIDTWLDSEMSVHDPIHCYAGTLDAVAKMKNGKIYVIDFKSSKGFYSGYDMQIAAYRNAYQNQLVDGMGILRLDKSTGLPEWKDYSKVYDNKLNAFLLLTDFYYAVAKRRCKNARTMV
jgi:hypothetical protein